MNALDLYRWMVVSRQLESALCEANPRWFPAKGEEATIVGSFAGLRDGDIAAPHYRGPFVVYLMRGAEMRRLVCQAFGKAQGYNKGRSVPFTGPGNLRIVPWVAGDLGTSLGIATGAALALKQENRGRVCVCSFGDGTSNRGDFHENLNSAAVWKLPIVYVCQNNGWAISQDARSYLHAHIVDRAQGYGMPGEVVDGNDAAAVQDVVGAAIERAAGGGGPTLIEARTWRSEGHWASDKALYRGQAGSPPGMVDPVQALGKRLVETGASTPDGLARVRQAVDAQVAAALAYATEQADAGAGELGLNEVFA